MGAKGIDIFRVYQNVTDWLKVKQSGVEYCWIKATHGLGIATYNADRKWAPAPADPTVAGARSVGIAPGLYHWGKGNDPEDEADLFAGEVVRLGCRGPGTLPPALDAEDSALGPSWAARRAWCIAFLKRLQERIGQQRVAIYMNASWAQALRPDKWDIPGLVIWIAAYGSNTGARSTRAITDLYDGRYDVQQFTSLGLHLVGGIESQGLDVNEADTPLDHILGGDDMQLNELINFRPDLGGAPRNLWDGIAQLLSNQAATNAALAATHAMIAAIAKNPDITREALAEDMRAAVKESMPTADQVAEAQRPHLREAMREVLGEDNDDQADEILQRMGDKLAAAARASS